MRIKRTITTFLTLVFSLVFGSTAFAYYYPPDHNPPGPPPNYNQVDTLSFLGSPEIPFPPPDSGGVYIFWDQGKWNIVNHIYSKGGSLEQFHGSILAEMSQEPQIGVNVFFEGCELWEDTSSNQCLNQNDRWGWVQWDTSLYEIWWDVTTREYKDNAQDVNDSIKISLEGCAIDFNVWSSGHNSPFGLDQIYIGESMTRLSDVVGYVDTNGTFINDPFVDTYDGISDPYQSQAGSQPDKDPNITIFTSKALSGNSYNCYGLIQPSDSYPCDPNYGQRYAGSFAYEGNGVQFSTICISECELIVDCPTDFNVDNDIGECGAVVNYDVPVTGNCTGITVIGNPPSGSLFPVGITQVEVIVADDSDQADTCYFNVTVNDTEPPAATCPGDITVGNDPGECGAVVNFSSNVSDNCSGASISCSPPSGSFFPVGITEVTCVAVDDAGNADTCTFNVIVVDTEPPAATCPGDITVGNDPGECGAAVSYSSDVSDNCSGASISCSPPSGSFFPVGITEVTCIAVDAAGNADTCTFNVIVVDTEPPAASCPGDVTIGNDPGECGAVVSYSSDVSDNCSGASISCSPPSGSFFPVGTTEVTCVAVDAAGNADTCSFNVIVNDTEPPAASCSGDITASNDPGECGAVVSYSSDVSDNCAGASISCSPPSGSFFSVGTTSVTCVAVDAAGNLDSCSFNITVTDTVPPVISCPVDDTVQCSSDIPLPDTSAVTATDDCDPTPIVTWVGDSSDGQTCPETITRTYRATDISGNWVECSQVIIINDTIPPTFDPFCPADTTVECDNVPDAPVLTAADNCDTILNVIFVEDTTTGSCPNNYILTRTWTVTDDCGNTAQCVQVVTVEDTTPPTFEPFCPADTTVECDNVPDAPILTASDNCGSAPNVNLVEDTTFGSCTGNYTITRTWTATDECSNTAQCVQNVTVQDTTPPECPAIDDVTFSLCDVDTICVEIPLPMDNCGSVTCQLDTVSPGILTNNTWCYVTSNGSETLNVVIICTDDCGRECITSFAVEILVNTAPQLSIIAPDTVIVCGAGDTVCADLSIYDPNNGLSGSSAIGWVNLEDSTVCFIVDSAHTYYDTVTITDSCGLSASASYSVVVEIQPICDGCPSVKIEKIHNSVQGQYETISIIIDSLFYEIGGFDLLIEYDPTALNFSFAVPGQFIEDCEWEYFTYRYGPNGNCGGNACPSGKLRLAAIAEINNGPIHPDCYTTTTGELARLTFLITNDRTFECQYVSVHFCWYDCGDNTISSKEGDILYISRDVYNYYDGDSSILITDLNAVFPTLLGANTSCDIAMGDGKPDPVRCVDYYNGGIDIICSEDIDARGDINLNEFAYEVADAVVFSNYFIYGISAFTIYPAGQIAASDVNADGLTLSVADLVYLIRIIVGDALPYPKVVTPGQVEYTHASNGSVTVNNSLRIGGAFVILEGDVTPELKATNMTMLYNYDGTNTRVLIYSLDGASFTEEFLNVSSEIISIEMADFEGNPVVAKWVPDKFALIQNYPNPFNPMTNISFMLPLAADYKLTIFNVNGQKVTAFSGNHDAGLVEIEWDASDMASGIYFYKLEAGSFTDTKKMVLLK